MKNMNKFCWQLRRQDIIWAEVQADVISSIMAKLEVAKNIHRQMWFFFAIRIPSGNIYRTRAIISRDLYIFYPIFKDHFFTFKEVF